jgi:hypothetical protein
MTTTAASTAASSGRTGTARAAVRPGRAALILVAAVVVAIAANAIIAAAAVAAGAGAFPALGFVAFGPATLVGVGIATAGWALVRRVAAHPARLLRVLVPVLTVLSFTPDVILLVTGFIPGATVTAVVALMLMHLVVVSVSVGALSRALPARD